MSAERPSQTTWSDPNLPWAQFLEHCPLPFNMESCPDAESEMVLVLPWQATDMKINSHALHYQLQLASPVLPELSVLGVPVRKVSAKRAVDSWVYVGMTAQIPDHQHKVTLATMI